MTIEKAREFVGKFYTNDDFFRGVIRRSGVMDPKQSSLETNEEQMQKIVATATELGYEATVDEFEAATKEYFERLGGWKALLTIFHMGKVGKQMAVDEGWISGGQV